MITRQRLGLGGIARLGVRLELPLDVLLGHGSDRVAFGGERGLDAGLLKDRVLTAPSNQRLSHQSPSWCCPPVGPMAYSRITGRSARMIALPAMRRTEAMTRHDVSEAPPASACISSSIRRRKTSCSRRAGDSGRSDATLNARSMVARDDASRYNARPTAQCIAGGGLEHATANAFT